MSQLSASSPLKVRSLILAVLILLGSLFVAPLLAHEPQDHLEQTIERLYDKQQRGDYAAANELARAATDDFAGIPAFDLAAGLAHLNAGDPQLAARAFERIVIVEPTHDRARLELGRALFLSGELTAARTQFSSVIDRSPPPQVAERAQQFIAAIDRRLAARSPTTRFWVEGQVGYDSNVTAASDDLIQLFTVLGPIGILDKAESDYFYAGHAGGAYHTPWVADRQWRLRSHFQHRRYRDFTDYDQTFLQLHGSRVVNASERSLYLFGGEVQHVRLDGDNFLSRFGLSPRLHRRLGARTQLRIEAALSHTHHAQNEDRNAWKLGTAGGIVHAFDSPLGIVSFNRLGLSREQANYDLYSQNAADLSSHLQLRLTPSQAVMASAGLRYQFYDQAATRQDGSHWIARGGDESTERSRLIRATAGYSFSFASSGWSVHTTASHLRKRANITPLEFDRNQVTLSLRHDWE